MAYGVYNGVAFTTASGLAVAPTASIEVRREDTAALATIYRDVNGATPESNPFNADSSGRFTFYAAGLALGFKVTVTKNAESLVVRNVPIGLLGYLDAPVVDATQINFLQAGTGAVARTVQNKERDVVSITDFYANGVSGVAVDPTGVVDSTLGIQAALNIAMASPFALRITIPRGVYRVTSTLTYDAGPGYSLRITGDSIGRGLTGSRFKWDGAAGGTVFKLTGANSIFFEHWGIDMNASADKGIWFENAAGAVGSSDIVLDDIKVTNGRQTTKSVCIQFGSANFQVSEVRITRCLLQACYYGMLSFTANVKNFSITDSGVALCFWGICHGSPDSGPSVGGHFLVETVNFGQNGYTSGGYFNGVAGAVDKGGDIFMASGVVIGCESEGCSRFIGALIGTIGNNHGHVVLIKNQFELSSNVPTDDYVVRTGGGLTMIGNLFQNSRTGSSIAKVQCFGLTTNYTGLTTMSQSVYSEGNLYTNAAEYAPIYDGSDNWVFAPGAIGLENSYQARSFGDMGGDQNVALKTISLDGAASFAAMRKTVASTTVIPDAQFKYQGLLSIGVNKTTVKYTDLIEATTLQRQFIWDIPARTKITNVVADVTQAFAGLAGTIQLRLGDSAFVSEDNFILLFDIKTAAVTKGLLDADLGASLARATAIQGGCYYWAVDKFKCGFLSGAGNFGTGAASNCNAGSVDIYVTVERMP